MLEAVIFDFDGIIVDTPTYYFKHMREYFRKINVHVTDEDISGLVGLTFAKKLEHINKKYGVEIEREPFVSETSGAMMAEMEKSLLIDAHLDALLKELSKAKIVMAIASNNSAENIDFFLQRLGIAGHFSEIIAYADVGNHKPAPDTYQKAVECLGAMPQNCVAIEDTVVGVESAKSAGLKCVAMPNKFTTAHNFEGADFVIKSFAELDLKKLRELVS